MGLLDRCPDLLAHQVIRMRIGALRVQQQAARRRDGRHDVDVSSGAEALRVTGQPAWQPDGVIGTDGPGQFGFDVGLGGAGVAAGIQLHGLGDQDRAQPVDLDPAAFVHQVRVDHRHAGPIGNSCTDFRVVIPLCPILGTPAVEHPVHRRHRTVPGVYEGGADIAHPGVVQRSLDDVDRGGQIAPGRGDLGGVHHHRHRFELQHRVGDRRPGAAGFVVFGFGVAQRVTGRRERHPDTILRRTLGRHPVAGHFTTAVAS